MAYPDRGIEFLSYNGWPKIFQTKCLFIFDPSESTSNESEAIGQHQNLVLFQNMCLEILSEFLFESSEIISEKPKNLVWTDNFSAHSFYFHYCDSKLKVGIFIYISACRSEATLQNALFQVFFVFQQGTSIFVFPKYSFLKNRPFYQKLFYVERSS